MTRTVTIRGYFISGPGKKFLGITLCEKVEVEELPSHISKLVERALRVNPTYTFKIDIEA